MSRWTRKEMVSLGIRDALQGLRRYGRPDKFQDFNVNQIANFVFDGGAGLDGNGRVKLVGTGWGNSGIRGTKSLPRASGRVFVADVVPGSNANTIVGFHDGAGISYTDFVHGIYFYSTGTIGIFENGNFRGNVGSGFTPGTLYRVRITIGTTNAVYQIQGGAYGTLGSASWTNITPGTTSSSTDPVYAAAASELSLSYVDSIGMW